MIFKDDWGDDSIVLWENVRFRYDLSEGLVYIFFFFDGDGIFCFWGFEVSFVLESIRMFLGKNEVVNFFFKKFLVFLIFLYFGIGILKLFKIILKI